MTSPRTVEDFERQYAARINLPLEELRERDLHGEPCACGKDGCDGWRISDLDFDAHSAMRLRNLRATHGADHPLTQRCFDERTQEVLAEENDAGETGVWWLSFADPTVHADPSTPGGPGFLGVVIVHADGYLHAVQKAWGLGVNPGGQVAGTGPLDARHWTPEFCAAWMDRLLTAGEIATMPNPDPNEQEQRP